MIKFRNYLPEDYRYVKEILQEAGLFYESWHSEKNLSSMIKKDPELVQVAFQDKVVGCMLIVPLGAKVAYFFSLAVKKEFRNQGIATNLIKHAEEIMRKKGASELGLLVLSENKELVNFYKKRGFNTSGKNYFYMWK
ncbi:MAG TPA: GNAT family N-acetyltransferase [Patescibacteria group bacterium]|jgi:ribosomal protein S18 acetylase RimI-like enzyme|nr:GNAT family N-acetyltransferase [Patescibacteria group bacterium]